MKSKMILIMMIGIMIAIGMIGATVAEQNRGAKDIVIPSTKGDVPFPHHTHQTVLGMDQCNLCHDLFPQTPGSIAELKAQGKLEKKQVMNKKCIKCHNEKKNAGLKTGPTSCSACHK